MKWFPRLPCEGVPCLPNVSVIAAISVCTAYILPAVHVLLGALPPFISSVVQFAFQVPLKFVALRSGWANLPIASPNTEESAWY